MSKLSKSVMQDAMIGALAACSRSETKNDTNVPTEEHTTSDSMSHEMGPFFLAETEMNQRIGDMLGLGRRQADDSVLPIQFFPACFKAE